MCPIGISIARDSPPHNLYSIPWSWKVGELITLRNDRISSVAAKHTEDEFCQTFLQQIQNKDDKKKTRQQTYWKTVAISNMIDWLKFLKQRYNNARRIFKNNIINNLLVVIKTANFKQRKIIIFLNEIFSFFFVQKSLFIKGKLSFS